MVEEKLRHYANMLPALEQAARSMERASLHGKGALDYSVVAENFPTDDNSDDVGD